MMRLFIRFAGDESGVTVIEYGLIVALVVLGIISSLSTIGTTLNANFYEKIANGFN
jgi:pilus assembly protein Flp/PilA